MHINGILNEALASGLLLQEVLHGVFALPFAYLLWKKTKSKKLVLILFLTTYLVDLDHLVDYFGYFGFNFSFLEFIKADYFQKTGRSITPFHAWEWTLILAVISWKKGWKSIYTAFLFGLLPHFIFDSLTVDFLSYSLFYRLYLH